MKDEKRATTGPSFIMDSKVITHQELKVDDPVADPENPKNWTNLKKWGNFSIVFLNAFIGYFTSSVYMPATEDLRDYFNTNLTVINATIALLFWPWPYREKIGRKPVYVGAMGGYTVVTIVCAVSNNLALFFVMRVLQGVFSSTGMAVGGGTAADMFHPHERGRAISLLTLSLTLGPAVSPLLGGYVAQNLGWRWIFYICAIIGGHILLISTVLMRETLYRPNRSDEAKPKTIKERLAYLKFDPLRALRLLLHLDVFLMCFPTAIGFGWLYFLVTILSPTYAQIYHFDTGSLGLLYFSSGTGNCLGAFCAGQASDRVYAYIRKRIPDRIVKKEARLIPLYAGIPLLVGGHLMFGWLLHARVHWFAPLIGIVFISFGTMYTLVIANTYLVDTYLPFSASVTSSATFIRNIMAMVLSVASASTRARLGDGWVYTLGALMSLFFTAFVSQSFTFTVSAYERHTLGGRRKRNRISLY